MAQDEIIQAIGLIALAAGISSVQFKTRRGILMAQLFASGLWFAHFGFLGAFTGAFLNAIGVLRTASFHRFKQSRYAGAVFWSVMVIVLLVGILTWNTAVSLLAISGMLLSTIALWQRDEQRIRWLLLANAPLWFGYDLLIGSYAGMVNEIFFASSIVIALMRYRRVRHRYKNAS